MPKKLLPSTKVMNNTRFQALLDVQQQLSFLEEAEARQQAEQLVAHVCACTRHELYTQRTCLLTQEQSILLMELVSKRRQRVPLQHLIGHVSFFNADLEVNGHVLIPRPETEELCELVCRSYPAHFSGDILDMCTGSGAIAVALSKAFPRARVTAVDISAQALEVAKRNAVRNGCDKKIMFIWSNLFQHVAHKFDIIVANPPYVPSAEVAMLQPEVSRYEPHLALDGGEDGLIFYRRLFAESLTYLKSDGYVFVEMGHNQGAALLDIAGVYGYEGCIYRDHRGLERFCVLKKTSAS